MRLLHKSIDYFRSRRAGPRSLAWVNLTAHAVFNSSLVSQMPSCLLLYAAFVFGTEKTHDVPRFIAVSWLEPLIELSSGCVRTWTAWGRVGHYMLGHACGSTDACMTIAKRRPRSESASIGLVPGPSQVPSRIPCTYASFVAA